MIRVSKFLRRLAVVRAVYALLASADDDGAVVAIMTAYPDAKEAGGLTDRQISRINEIGDSQAGTREMADAFANIIWTNHGLDPDGMDLVDAAAELDLVRAIRLVERETILPPTVPSSRDLIERLDRIRRIVAAPCRLLAADDLDDTQAEPVPAAQRSLRF